MMRPSRTKPVLLLSTPIQDYSVKLLDSTMNAAPQLCPKVCPTFATELSVTKAFGLHLGAATFPARLR